MTDELRDIIDEKNEMWNRIKKSKNPKEIDIRNYNMKKKEVSKRIKLGKQEYYEHRLTNLQKEEKNIWEMVDDITGNKRKKKLDDELRTTFKDRNLKKLSNEFNDVFKSQILNIKEKSKEEHEEYKNGR